VEQIAGTVERIVFQNPDNHFAVVRLCPDDAPAPRGRYDPDRRAAATTIVGFLPGVKVGEAIIATGEWKTHPKYGPNFEAAVYEPRLPTTREGIIHFLGSGLINGVGKRTAQRIVQALGDETLDIMENDPGRLSEVPGIGRKKGARIAASWAEQSGIRNLALFLGGHGVSMGLAARIYRAYGADAASVVRSNPYAISDMPGVGFRTADLLATALGLPPDAPARYAAGLRFALAESAREGHVYLTHGQLLERGRALLRTERMEGDAATADLTAAVARLVAARAIVAVADGPPDAASGGPSAADRLYQASLYRAECAVAERLCAIRETPSDHLLERAARWPDVLTDLERAQGLALAPGQRPAVEMALTSKVSVLTGGPGVGKTTTLRAILTLLEDHGARVLLTAPTGRAAKRMTEATGREARTIHRVLEFSPQEGGFLRDENDPLDVDVVVVDEASMIDIMLMHSLSRAIRPASRLLLVGDVDQLPSVGPGNVLRDIIASGAVPVTRLTDLFRQAAGSRIITTAHAINAGTIPDLGHDPDSDLFFIRQDDSTRVAATIRQLVETNIPRRYGFDARSEIQVIAPGRRGPAGVDELNRTLQELLTPTRGDDVRRGERAFRVGDRVMQIKNNYGKGVFNGDMGAIVDIDEEDACLVVSYPGEDDEGTPVEREVDYGFDELEGLTHAYAVTVHKSQGSEFPVVIMPLTLDHYMLLRRNLIYTGITRAKSLCVLVGSTKALGMAVRTSDVDRRQTGLRARLSLATAPAH